MGYEEMVRMSPHRSVYRALYNSNVSHWKSQTEVQCGQAHFIILTSHWKSETGGGGRGAESSCLG